MTAVSRRVRASWAQSYAEWLVILVVVVALAAGWGVKTYAENHVERYSASGITVSYPGGWLPSRAADGTLRFRDGQGGGVAAAITVRAASAADAQAAAGAIAVEAEGLVMARGQALTAFRVLSIDDKTTFRGQPARRVSYAYVQDEPNAFQQHLPIVMLGEDLVTYQQGRVYVFTLQAPQEEFAQARRRYQALVESAAFGPR